MAVVAWVAAPAQALYNTAKPEGTIYGQENFEALNVGDSAFAGNLIDIGGTAATRDYLVNNDHPEWGGNNHLDGDSSGDGGWSGFDINQDQYSESTIYLQGVFASAPEGHQNNYSPGVLNSSGSTQYSITYINPDKGWGWGVGPNGGAHSGPWESGLPTVITHTVNLDGGFATTYSFTAFQPATGQLFSHGPVENHIPGFSTPSGRIFYDRRAAQSWDFDDLITASDANPLIPEPTTISLLGLGGVLLLRPRRRA